MKLNVSQICSLLPARPKKGHKGDGGKVMIIAGGTGLYGAGLLSALAATRCGAGYTHLMTDLSRFPWLKFPDFIVHKFSLSELKKTSSDMVIGFGPGAGVNLRSENFLQHLIKNNTKVILDADALSILARKTRKLPSDWILTPHDVELARLMKTNVQTVRLKRKEWAIKAQEKFGCVIVLKGYETLIVDQASVVELKAGCRSLAKAGTGDVLLGMMAAFYAQGLSALDAALLSVYVHGQTSQFWEKKKQDHLSMRPLDLIELLPQTLYKLRRGSGVLVS